MKTFTKVVLIISSILIVVGISLVIVSLALGAKFHDSKLYNTYDYTNTYTDVNSLKIDVSVGRVIVKEGQEFKIEAVDVAENKFSSSVKNGVWTIKEDYNSKHFLDFFIEVGNGISIINYSPKITIYVPDNFKFDETSITIKTGEGIIDELNTGKLLVDVGTGSLTINNLSSKESSIDCGVGNIKINGLMLGDNKIDCGVGQIELNLIGNESDYNYKYSVGLGKITINDSKYSNGSDNGKIDNDASNSFDLDCGVGSIKIKIKE